MYLLGTTGVGLIVVAMCINFVSLASLGIAFVGLGCTMAVIRDNQRTRRMLKRPGENLSPLR
jgi:hypothetical protein